MFKTILLPIDISHLEKVEGMLECAERLGGEDARLILLSVIEDIPGYVAANLPRDLGENLEQEAREELTSIAKRALSKTTSCEVRAGRAPSEILKMAKECAAELIVIGSHRPEFQDYLLGTTSARVVRHAECSVLVIR